MTKPATARRAALTAAERELIEMRYLEGATIPEIAGELGRSWSVVGRCVKALGISRPMGPTPKYPPAPTDRTCRHCGIPLTFSSPYYASGSRGQFCSRECFRAQVKTGEPVTCPVCGKERYRPASHVQKLCCGYRCAARYRWQRAVGIVPFIKAHALPGRGHWPGATRRLWHLRAAPRPGRPRNDSRLDYEDALERIREKYNETHATERDLQRLTGESRRMVRTALGRPL
jgi:hypothetical protein